MPKHNTIRFAAVAAVCAAFSARATPAYAAESAMFSGLAGALAPPGGDAAPLAVGAVIAVTLLAGLVLGRKGRGRWIPAVGFSCASRSYSARWRKTARGGPGR